MGSSLGSLGSLGQLGQWADAGRGASRCCSCDRARFFLGSARLPCQRRAPVARCCLGERLAAASQCAIECHRACHRVPLTCHRCPNRAPSAQRRQASVPRHGTGSRQMQQMRRCAAVGQSPSPGRSSGAPVNSHGAMPPYLCSCCCGCCCWPGGSGGRMSSRRRGWICCAAPGFCGGGVEPIRGFVHRRFTLQRTAGPRRARRARHPRRPAALRARNSATACAECCVRVYMVCVACVRGLAWPGLSGGLSGGRAGCLSGLSVWAVSLGLGCLALGCLAGSGLSRSLAP